MKAYHTISDASFEAKKKYFENIYKIDAVNLHDKCIYCNIISNCTYVNRKQIEDVYFFQSNREAKRLKYGNHKWHVNFDFKCNKIKKRKSEC